MNYAKFLPIAKAIAGLSKDRSTKVGAIAVGPSGDIRAMGYNGFPRGCDDNNEAKHARPEKYLWTEHAERNLIFNAARVGVPLEGCTIVVSGLYPCMDCARAIVQSGIRKVIAPTMPISSRWADQAGFAKQLFDEVGVEVIEYGEKDGC
jgi:dCMP deaminase